MELVLAVRSVSREVLSLSLRAGKGGTGFLLSEEVVYFGDTVSRRSRCLCLGFGEHILFPVDTNSRARCVGEGIRRGLISEYTGGIGWCSSGGSSIDAEFPSLGASNSSIKASNLAIEDIGLVPC